MCLGICQDVGNVQNVYAVDDEDLTEIPLTKITIGGSNFQYNTDNVYDVHFGQYNVLMCYLKEPSLFELPYVVDLTFELTSAQFERVRHWTNFAPRAVKDDGSFSGSTASTWMDVNIRYNYVDGTTGSDNLYDYNYDSDNNGTNDFIRTSYPHCTRQVSTVNYHIKAWFTNRVGMRGYGIRFDFAGFTNADKPVWVKVKTDGAEMQQLKTIAKNTQDTATGITGILEFLPNMVTSIGEFFTNLINTIVQKFSDLIDDITDLFTDLTTSLSGFFSNLVSSVSGFFDSLKNKLTDLFNTITSAISGFFDNLIQNLVDLFDAITTAIGDFFADLLQGIKDFFTWLFIPEKEDIEDMIEGFESFWDGSLLTVPLQFVTRIVASLNTINPSDCVNQTIQLPRWYMNINGTNHRIWNNQNINLMDSNGMIYYILNHDFSSGSYPYLNANSARLGGFYVFWIFAIFRVIKNLSDLFGIGEFIYNKVVGYFTDGETYDV